MIESSVLEKPATIESYVQASVPQFLEELCEWLKIPSISSLPQHKADILRSVDWASAALVKLGFKTEILRTKGQPSLYAERIEDKRWPTLLVYGHLDVQPVDPVEQWIRPPFEPCVQDGRLWGRGAADDKGQTFIHIKACETWLKTRGRLPLNVKFIIEGEEEIGSPNFEALVREHQGKLAGEAVVISDTAMLAKGVPTVSYATRGLVYFDVVVEGPKLDLHSGSFGGAVLNPALVLAKILAAMTDRKGRVAIPCFYQDVAKLTKLEKKMFSRARFVAKEIEAVAGVPCVGGEKGYSVVERVWARPTFEVHGLTGGFQGEGSKTIIPQRAGAKVSMRLVPNQNPGKIVKSFERWVAKLTPKGVKVRVSMVPGGGPAFVEDLDQPVFQAAFRALRRAFGAEPVFERCGGSIFAPEIFKRAYAQTPVLMMGFGLPGENAHAPNEWLDLDNFRLGIIASAYFYEEFANKARNK